MAMSITVLSLIFSITCFVTAEYVSLGNAKYFVSTTKVNWYEAARICKAEHGMILIDIVDEKESSRVLEVIKPFMGNADARYWTSGTDLGSEGAFYWASSGHSMLFNNFTQYQPDNWGGHEHCVEITKDYDFKWNDVTCTSEFYFICRNTVSYPLNNCICLNS